MLIIMALFTSDDGDDATFTRGDSYFDVCLYADIYMRR